MNQSKDLCTEDAKILFKTRNYAIFKLNFYVDRESLQK